MDTTPLTERLIAAAGNRTHRAIAELTGTSAETVRRYMHGQAPSVEFLAAFCQALGISEPWLISGRGPMRASQLKHHALDQASPSELLATMAATIERLIDRVDRLELFLGTLEARLRARSVSPSVNGYLDSKSSTDTTDGSPATTLPEATLPESPPRSRARFIADAVPERSRHDAR